MKSLMWCVMLVGMMMMTGGAVANETPIGVCGGVTWLDDPDLAFRLFLVEESDLPDLAEFLEQVEIEHDVVSVSLYQKNACRATAAFECGVVVARRVCDINIPNDCDDNP